LKNMPADKRVECVARGSVQGVFYRALVKQKASMLGVKGYARNEADGSVRIAAEGSETALRDFLRLIKVDDGRRRVEGLEVKWLDAKNEFDSFSIG